KALCPLQAKSNQIPGPVVGKQQTARRCEQTSATTKSARRSFEAISPGDLSRLVIDRGDMGSERSNNILFAPAEPDEHARIFVRQVVHRVELAHDDIEETGLGIVAGRIPVRRAPVTGRYQRDGDRVVLLRVPYY